MADTIRLPMPKPQPEKEETEVKRPGGTIDPRLYATANDLQRRDAGDVIEEYGEEIGEMKGRCLDIGSGPGDVVFDYILPRLNRNATLVCSDISESMVNFGRERYKDNDRLSFVKLDIETQNLSNEYVDQFDHVLSFYCLHWCQNMRQVFRNIFKMLRPGGTSLFAFIASNPGFKAYETLAKRPQYEPFMKDFRRFIPFFQNLEHQRETLKTILRDIGFEVVHCSRREKTYVYHNSNDLKKNAMAVNPFLERMPDDVRKNFQSDLTKEITKQKIVFSKTNNNNKAESSILSQYYLFVGYVKKP